MMRVLNSLSYYRPHFSGLTVYTERLARSMAARGHEVTVLTSKYDPTLPSLENIDGVEVRRVSVAFKVSKGPIMPAFPLWGLRLLPRHDVLHLHIPQFDAALMAFLAKLLGKPVVMTYHCDLQLPPSLLNRIANGVSNLVNYVSAMLADVVVTNTLDYAENSSFLRRYLDKLEVIPPPIEVAPVGRNVVDSLRAKWNIQPEQQVIGMAARLATEKGAEILARALPIVLEEFPNARVLYAGQYKDVMGEEGYAHRLEPILNQLGAHWTFLDVLPDDEWSAFFSVCDVTVLPSLNSTESFGMVQVESLLCGTPVVASDLPGMRQPVLTTGMGMVFPPGDIGSLAERIINILKHPDAYQVDVESVMGRYGTDRVAVEYERVYESVISGGSAISET
jgi:glycosyltransferase involved in cell wall biosynthesis